MKGSSAGGWGNDLRENELRKNERAEMGEVRVEFMWLRKTKLEVERKGASGTDRGHLERCLSEIALHYTSLRVSRTGYHLTSYSQ